MTTPIGFVLTLDGERQVTSGMQRVGASMDSADKAVTGLKSSLGGLAGAFAGAISVNEFIQAADAVTNLQNRLALATGSAKAAGEAYAELFRIAQQSRTGFLALGDTFASISTAAGDLGVSQQRLLKVTEAIGNAVTVSGSSAQAAQAALMQLGQGLASGTLRGEELNSVMEQTPRLAKAIADGMGIARGELRELGAQGAITAKQVIEALESQAATLAKEVGGATMTVGQAFTQLKNSATVAVGDFDKASGATNTLASAMSGLAKSIDGLGRTVREHEEVFRVLGGTIVGAGSAVAVLGVASALGKIGAAIGAVGIALAANPAVLALLGLGAAVGGGLAIASAYNKTERGTREAIAALEEANKRSEEALGRAVAGGRTAGADNIRNTIAERNKTIAGLKGEMYVAESTGIDNRAEDARLARTTGALADQKREADELAAMKRKLYGVDENYLPTLNKLNAAYKAEKITLKEYQELVGKLADANYKKPDGGAANAAAKDTLDAQLEKLKQREKELQNTRKDTLASYATDVKLGRMSELDQIEASFEAEEKAWAARKANYAEELALVAKQKDSKTEQLKVLGDMAEADRDYAEAKTKRETELLLLNQRNVNALADRIEKEQAAALAGAEEARLAQLQLQAIGLEGAALGELHRAEMLRKADDLEAKARIADLLPGQAALAQAYRDQAKAMREGYDARAATQSAAMVDEYARSVKEAGESLQFELSVMGLTERERATAIEQRRIELDLIRRRKEIMAGTVDQPEERARQLGDLEAAGIKDKANAENKVFLQEWQKTVNQYDEIFRNGFVDMVNSGKDGWDAFTKSLATTFKTTVADAIYQQFVRPLVVNVVGSFLGIGGGGGGVMGGAGGGSNLLGMVSNASSLYNGASAVGSIFSGAQGLGTLSSYAAGYSGAVLPASMVGPSIQAPTVLSNLGYLSNTGTLAGGGSAAGGAGMGAWGAGGVAALIMLGVINALGGMRSESMVGSGLAGTLGSGKALTPWQEWREGGTLFDGSSFATHNPLEELDYRRKQLQDLRDSGQGESNFAVGLQAIVTDLEKTTKGLAEQTAVFDREINKGYKTYRDNVVKMADSLGLAGSSIEDFAYTLGAQDLNLQGLKPEEVQAKIQEVFGKAGDAMAKEVLGSWREVTDTVVNTYVAEQMTQANDGRFVTETTTSTRMEYVASVYAKTGETAIQTLERLSTSFNTLNETADALGFGIQQGSLALADFSDKFIEAFGGLEKFNSTTSAYMQNYYTDDERKQSLLRSGARQANRLFGADVVTAESLEQLGRDGIRAFVTGLTANGGTAEEIRDAMDLANFLSPAFESLDAQKPVVETLSTAVDELTQAYTNAVKSLKSDADSLAVDLLRAQGNEAGAKALERQQYLAQFAGLDSVRQQEIATLYDANEATRTYIQTLEKQAETSRTLAEELDALLNSVRSPADRIAVGYGTVAGNLQKAGVNADANWLATASMDQIGAAAVQLYNLGTTSDETRLAIVRAVTSLKSLREATVDNANAAFQREAQERRAKLQDTIADIRAVFDATGDAARSLLMDVDSASTMLGQQGRDFIRNAADMARATGQLPDSKKLQEAIGAATGDIGKAVYATQFEADRDRLVLGNRLRDISDIAGVQLTTQEQELKSLEDMVEKAQAQLDALSGIDTSVKGLDARFAELTSAILAAQVIKNASGGGVGGTITQPTGYLPGANGAGLDLGTGIGYRPDTGLPYMLADVKAAAEAALIAGQAGEVRAILAGAGLSMAQADLIYGLPPGTAAGWVKDMGLQPFRQGINLLPYDMPAMVHKGEAIIPERFNPFNPHATQPFGGAGQEEVVAELRTMNARLERLEAVAAGTENNTRGMPQLGREFSQWSNGGNVGRVKEIA